MPSVKIRPNESFDVGLRKFKELVKKQVSFLRLEKGNSMRNLLLSLKRKKAAAVKREQKNKEKNRLGRPPRF